MRQLSRRKFFKTIDRCQRGVGAGRHLLGIINDILDLSKIEADKMELYLKSFEVSALIDEVVSTIQPLLEKNANTLTVHLADDLGFMHTDSTSRDSSFRYAPLE
jgi:signal transduction histidine kinase